MDLAKKIAEHEAEIAKLTTALHMNQGALFAFKEMLADQNKPKGNLAPRANGELAPVTAEEPEGA